MADQSRDGVQDVWGPRTPYVGDGWPVRVDQQIEAEPDRWLQSCCVLCSNGCGLDVGVKDGRIVGVRGRADDRVNRGRLGPKGLHGWAANASGDRLTRPLIRTGKKGAGQFREASWDEAIGVMADRCGQTIRERTAGGIGVYNTGQLFLEEYYTLAVLARGGLGTNNIDGNTRLCTATAGMALQQTFGCDGQPGTLADLDHADCVLFVGHNMAQTQTVAWMRVLDRRRGADPPQVVVIDPRQTPTAAEADVHLAPRLGTNVAVMNGLLHLVIAAGQVDWAFVDRHTVGFDKLAATVEAYTPERVEAITGIPAAKLIEAARLVGAAARLTSSVLQGVYQSNQATAAAVQVNNLNLIRGMIGRPGCTVMQSNGQPTSQNTRETGCGEELPGFRNWHNERDVAELAGIWNVEPSQLPAWGPAMHAMEIFRAAETGAIRWLWVIGTNPAVSVPELGRVRKTLAQDRLFLVVQDAFLTETARYADVVLPTAMWGEKTGTFTNTDRTVHLSLKAVDPPGEARSDLDIFLDVARRMKLTDRDGQPLIKWDAPEVAFEAWKRCSAGRACDYTGITYAKLTGGGGVQWPCNAQSPDGTERLYTDHEFPTAADRCLTFGHDVETGAARTREEYRAEDPAGRAILKAAEYRPPAEATDDAYSFLLTSGRVTHQFHTRTKTGRVPALNDAAPEPFAQLNGDDAARLGIADGDVVEVATRRGTVRAAARVGDIEPGHVFVPFHYGYWDGDQEFARAANELTVTALDPVSKQPTVKYAAAQVRKAGLVGSVVERVADTAGKAVDAAKGLVDQALSSAHAERVRVGDYVRLALEANEEIATAAEAIAARHLDAMDVQQGLGELATFSWQAVELLRPFTEAYPGERSAEPSKLRRAVLPAAGRGSYGLLRDLHGLYLLAADAHLSNTVLMPAAKMLRDDPLLGVCIRLDEIGKRQLAWADTQLRVRSPQTLVVPQ